MAETPSPGHHDQPAPRRSFLRASWRDLVLLTYEIDPDLILPLVPRGTELDSWEGRTLVSVVGFRFLNTRILGMAIPFHLNFDEINLRFYVRRRTAGEWRNGVVFIREVVARTAIAAMARFVYNEPYGTLPTRHLIAPANPGTGKHGLVRYQWRQNRWYTIEATTQGPAAPLKPGSEDEFITWREWGYTRQRDGSTMEYQVTHPRWPVWNALACRLDCDVERMYGRPFVAALRSTPRTALVAEGSGVRVSWGRRI